jgi:hypothetical protein
LSPVLAILTRSARSRDRATSRGGDHPQGAYENPLLIAISTQAPTDNDLFPTWLDAQRNAPDRVVSHVYAAPEIARWMIARRDTRQSGAGKFMAL